MLIDRCSDNCFPIRNLAENRGNASDRAGVFEIANFPQNWKPRTLGRRLPLMYSDPHPSYQSTFQRNKRDFPSKSLRKLSKRQDNQEPFSVPQDIFDVRRQTLFCIIFPNHTFNMSAHSNRVTLYSTVVEVLWSFVLLSLPKSWTLPIKNWRGLSKRRAPCIPRMIQVKETREKDFCLFNLKDMMYVWWQHGGRTGFEWVPVDHGHGSMPES
jgi:hypothetical protein